MNAIWFPQSNHVSQLQYNPTTGGVDGREDCGPACLVRYLREAGKLDPHGDLPGQLNQIRLAINQVPDQPGQAGTSVPDLLAVLLKYGVSGARWTGSYAETQASPFAVVLVDNPPTPSQYPASWLGGQSHWILWLRQWSGAFNWFNDPLAYQNGQKDCQYDLGSVRAVFEGSILLPDVIAAHDGKLRAVQNLALKTQPNHTCSALARVGKGESLTETQAPSVTDGAHQETWIKVVYRTYTGWVPRSTVSPV